ncbi:ImmA/IrrE family metallo-endopeptidase [Lentibacillus salinarum]|uniref:ImmA/IrrE family metallo-endopeptidase n=1 Tax=Lentibacillus salinarum TaxID=446820 RepID=A0ABW3ZXB9_9BACI
MTWIKNIVHQIEKKYKTDNPFEICSLMNIHVIPWDLHEEINGFYKYDRRNKYIFINFNLNDDMQRFVCSHELGHAILHPRSNTPFLRNQTLFSIDKIEVEANTFAVELLMNDEKVYKFKDTNLSIREIGKIYGIPGSVVYLKKL